MLEAHWQGLLVVGRIVSEAFAERTGSRTIVVDTTSGSSSAVVSTVCTRGSPRSYPVVVVVVVDGHIAAAECIVECIEAYNFDWGYSFGRKCPTLAGCSNLRNMIPFD